MGHGFRRFIGIAADIAPGMVLFSLAGQFFFSGETAKGLAIAGGLAFIAMPYLLWLAASLNSGRDNRDESTPPRRRP